jgi:hypothetical protein
MSVPRADRIEVPVLPAVALALAVTVTRLAL